MIFLLFIIILIIAAFLFFQREGFREGQVVLKIEAPEEATAGEEIEYKVRVENKNGSDLIDTRLTFFYPEGSIPLNENGEALNSLINNLGLSILNSGEEREFILKVFLTGDRGEIKKARATFVYTPLGIRSVFQKNSEAETTISKISTPLTLSSPPNVLPGQRIQVSLDFRNETEQDLEDLEIMFSYPDGFLFKRAVPSATEGNNIFKVASLKAGEGERITIEGEIAGSERESKRFSAVLRRKIGSKFFDFQKAQTLTTVTTPLLTTEVLVQGEGSSAGGGGIASLNEQKSHIAEAGETLRYKIKFSNNSNNHFSALELSAKLDGQMFDLASLKSDGFFDQNTRTILWNAAVNPLLANLPPNEAGEVSFEIDLKDDFPKTFSKDYSLKVGSLIQTSSVPPDFDVDKISASANLITKVRSKTDFTSRAFYNDSVFPNSGPTPPRVGQKTTYTIHWKIINEGNDLTNLKIISFLLPGISWENKFQGTPSQSDIRYDPSLGRVTWLVPTVPAGTGVISGVFEAVFQVGITPSVNQVTQNVEIIKEAILEAVDNFTKENIMLTQPKITTQSISDLPGVVQP